MSVEKPYIPTPEEIKQDEKMMTKMGSIKKAEKYAKISLRHSLYACILSIIIAIALFPLILVKIYTSDTLSNYGDARCWNCDIFTCCNGFPFAGIAQQYHIIGMLLSIPMTILMVISLISSLIFGLLSLKGLLFKNNKKIKLAILFLSITLIVIIIIIYLIFFTKINLSHPGYSPLGR